ncbi:MULTISPECIES: ABC transporter ATP-binding protein [Caproicibacterium]|uniref:ATP-binding cassette domain-containing protein n=1 Tax=Caproicibacterium lactatifermentans TaxID=2666138 RepID=A0A859DWS5_9FIRM|nr:ABC transporter ATP-binding protein [Caproicibacterium lactatifermentans]ARP51317.1 ABC transporter [Ruminococcaceae bacterium CPB6]MDD4807654.1 ABC transporter ATP-binding protein [Oscillospiraceae bacterium]QKN24743.1 ATP-binding cassette domain-containing protein [Caproicibacterium lactatifermentans]QKO31148.1 ATP-binding cassette domain-containing protein [Caproicibacterium lactatifermentans]
MLQIQDLTKRFGTKTAVGHLNLTVEPGDIYGFIGQNGAGKTTTIRAVVGVMPFDAGEIRIDGHSVREEPVLCKSVTAYIPDNPDLYEYLTGIQYLDFIGDIFRVPADRRQKRIRKYSSLLGLTPVLGDLISSYSHGMKQKLAVLSTFLHTPKLLVLDEPFVGLDPEASYHLKAMMHELCAGGSAIFFSTHVLEVAEKLCNKIAILKDGKLIASGKTEDVRGNSSLEDVFLEVVGHES